MELRIGIKLFSSIDPRASQRLKKEALDALRDDAPEAVSRQAKRLSLRQLMRAAHPKDLGNYDQVNCLARSLLTLSNEGTVHEAEHQA